MIKLIRDLMPARYKLTGIREPVNQDELDGLYRDKLIEEFTRYVLCRNGTIRGATQKVRLEHAAHCVDALAELSELVRGIIDLSGHTYMSVEVARIKRRVTRGGYSNVVMDAPLPATADDPSVDGTDSQVRALRTRSRQNGLISAQLARRWSDAR